jgi:hypothetical protein
MEETKRAYRIVILDDVNVSSNLVEVVVVGRVFVGVPRLVEGVDGLDRGPWGHCGAAWDLEHSLGGR